MLARLWWKEWRAFGPAWLTLLLAAAGLQWLLLSVRSDDVRSGALTPAALVWAILYAFGVGSAAFAGERESRTLGFLDALPVGRPTLWLGKASFALASTLGLALVLAGLAALGTETRDPTRSYGYGPIVRGYGTLLFEAIAWGLLWSSLSSNPLVAGGMSVVSVAAVSMLAHRLIPSNHLLTSSEFIEPEAIPARLGLALAVLGASALAVSARPRRVGGRIGSDQAEPSPPGRSEIPIRRASVGRSLAWQTLREGTTTGALVVLIGLVIPVGGAVMGWSMEGPLDLCLALMASLVAGVAVFGPDGDSRGKRFPHHHGVGPGAVWGRRMAVWGFGMVPLLAAFLLGFARLGPITGAGGPSGLNRLGGDLGLIAAALIDAFAVGVVCGMAIPRRITAALVGVIGLVAMVPVQVAAVVLGMLPAWALLLSPAILIGISRAWAGDWLSEREGARPWVRLGLLLVVPFVMLGSGFIAYRAWGVPDPGPLLDPAAARGEPIPPGQDAAEGYRRAVALVKADAGIIRTPNWITGAPVNAVIAWGWDPDQAEVVAWWRENQPAIGRTREASGRPRARFNAVDRMTLASGQDPAVAGVGLLDQLLALDTRERISRGDLPGAWEDILAQLRMADHLAATTPTFLQILTAAEVHRRAVGLAMEWAGDPRQTPERIRAARDDLKRVPPLPSAAEALRVESFLLDRSLDLPADDLERLVGSEVVGRSALGSLAFERVLAPWWERTRARRVSRRMFAEIIPEAGRDPWQRSPGALLDRPPAGSPLVKLFFPASGSLIQALDREAVRRRALEQILALRSWQIGHGGQYPETLGALVPAELDRLPLDPFSGRPFGYVRSEGQPIRPPMLHEYGPKSDLRPTRPGQFLIYSVGPDGADDGGKKTIERPLTSGQDILFALP